MGFGDFGLYSNYVNYFIQKWKLLSGLIAAHYLVPTLDAFLNLKVSLPYHFRAADVKAGI
ncbi:hypothetical protein NIES4074_20720 [Cylindrospermum sp. NIES-4074]|nr:hypothetical protein NIES4074_20720 [Cylindrospermum sp. NIES-4074]